MTLDIIYIFKWWLIIFLMGASFLPLGWTVFNKFVDKGYLFSKVIGLLIISYSIYIFSSLHILKFNTISLIIVWAISTIIIWCLFKIKIKPKKQFIIFIGEELLFLLALILWSFVRGFQPAIHDLEKFMDFGFLNSILRTDYFPPRDMWFTPFSINYYYFGHLYTAVLTKLSTIPAYISFNLMLVTVFAFTLSLSFSIGINLFSNFKKISKLTIIAAGLFISFLVTLSGNLQTIYSLFSGYNAESPVPFWKLAISFQSFPNSYWYPNATRFIFHTIHEFPSYSFVVADLHGHVLDIPIVLTILAILIKIVVEKSLRKIDIVLVSLLLAISYMTNAWDGIIYFGLFGLIAVILPFISSKAIKQNLLPNITNSFLKHVLPAGVLILIFSFIFNSNFSPFASGIGLNCSPNFLINLHKIGPLIFEAEKCNISPIWQLGILYGFFIFTLFSFIVFLRKKTLYATDIILLILSFYSIILIIIPEVFYLKDIYEGYFRANTMFKLTYQAFIMLSISSGYFLLRIILSIKEIKLIKSKLFLYFFLFLSAILLFFISIYPYFSIPSGYGNLKSFKGLNGIEYLREIKPLDYAAINWINKNISGQPVILEAQGDSYTDYGRISTNTGLPTVLGWTVHEWLWRGSYDIPASRFEDIKELYETNNSAAAKKIINKYNISLIYIGVLEKEKYKVSEAKFKILGKEVYSNQGSIIYKLN